MTAQRKAVDNHRRRLKRQGTTRALLRERFAESEAKGLNALLASAPLEGIDLTRERDLTLVTRNTLDIADLDVLALNPFEPAHKR